MMHRLVERLVERLGEALSQAASEAINHGERANGDPYAAWLAQQDRDIRDAWARTALLERRLAAIRHRERPG